MRRSIGFLTKAAGHLRAELFPTEQEKEIRRWWADGGDEKFRYSYDLNDDSLVLDLGGYKGQWASNIYAQYNCRVLVFEPVAAFAEGIKQKFRNNPRIEVFAFALGAARRQETIALNADGSSIFRASEQKELIQVEDVAEFFRAHSIASVDLMKVNIEGGEYEVMPRLVETGLIERIRDIQIQFHDIAPDSAARMDAIRDDMARTHFPKYQYRFVWENWTRRAP